jgi:hypothetical protein
METRTINTLNQLTQVGGAGETVIEGTVNEFATVQVTLADGAGATLIEREPAELRADPATGLELALYRAYDPGLGRWMSRDPFGKLSSQCNAEMMETLADQRSARIGAFASDIKQGPDRRITQPEILPEGPNLYSYVANDPLIWTDRLGPQGSDYNARKVGSADPGKNAYRPTQALNTIGKNICGGAAAGAVTGGPKGAGAGAATGALAGCAKGLAEATFNGEWKDQNRNNK